MSREYVTYNIVFNADLVSILRGIKMRVTYSSPVVLGRSFYVEYDSETKPQRLLEWAKDDYDVLVWIWKFHLVWSLEGGLRHGKEKRVGEGGSFP